MEKAIISILVRVLQQKNNGGLHLWCLEPELRKLAQVLVEHDWLVEFPRHHLSFSGSDQGVQAEDLAGEAIKKLEELERRAG